MNAKKWPFSGEKRGLCLACDAACWWMRGTLRAQVRPRSFRTVRLCFPATSRAPQNIPRVPLKGTRGVSWGAREVARKPKRTVLKLRARTWALRVPRIHLHAASHAKHSPLFSPEKGHFLAFTPGPRSSSFVSVSASPNVAFNASSRFHSASS